jgi:hypothetical protein
MKNGDEEVRILPDVEANGNSRELEHKAQAMTPDQMLDYFVVEGEKWILEQRTLHYPTAKPLQPDQRSALDPFFSKAVLDSARFAVVDQIPNPGFYKNVQAMGQPIPLDFGQMHGITFIDTVLLSKRFQPNWSPGLYFHELVHVIQYSILGTAKFMQRYIRGWADNGFEYPMIPLERDAYELQGRFEAQPSQAFSVEQVVAQRLAQRVTT